MLTLVAIFLGITLSSTFRFDFRQSRRTFKSNLTAITGLTEYKSQSEKVAMLRKMLNDSESIFIMPCCYDGLTAKLIQQAGNNTESIQIFMINSISYSLTLILTLASYQQDLI